MLFKQNVMGSITMVQTHTITRCLELLLFWNEYVTKKELIELQKKAYRIFYLRPSSIWNMIKQLRSFDEFKIKAKAGLDILGINFNSLKSKPFKADYLAPIR